MASTFSCISTNLINLLIELSYLLVSCFFRSGITYKVAAIFIYSTRCHPYQALQGARGLSVALFNSEE